MKPNLLSVSQLCDQGHKVNFNSQKCEIRKEGSRKLVATVARTSSNIYVLSEIGKEKEVEKEDEENSTEEEEEVRQVPPKKPNR
jgi:virulence-associated protein VagC